MFSSMLWTVPSMIGFCIVIGIIIAINIIDAFRPGYARKGFLPITTTRGDRVYISILSAVLVFFVWMKFLPEGTLIFSLAVVLPLDFVLITWG